MTRRDVQVRSAAVLPLVALLSVLGACSGGGSNDPGGSDPTDPLGPHGLAYAHNPVEYVRDVPIDTNTPTTTSGDPVKRYDASLPAGLKIDNATGVISGTPTAVGEGSYTVTASNDHGSGTVQLHIKVRDSVHYAISGRLIGGLPENATMEVHYASNDTFFARATPDTSGYWLVEGVTTGKWRVTNTSSYARIWPLDATVDVGTASVSGVDFYVAPATEQQAVCSIVPDSTTASIGGTSVPFHAVIVNWSQTPLTSVMLSVNLEQTINQKKTSRTLDYNSIRCEGADSGTLPNGVCKLSGTFSVPSTPFVAGPARLVLLVSRSASSTFANGTDIDLK